jgi:hypothetical protein
MHLRVEISRNPREALTAGGKSEERKRTHAMRDLVKRDTKHASRLPAMEQVLTMLAVLWLCMAGGSAQAQTGDDALPEAPSALLFSSSMARGPVGQPSGLAIEAESTLPARNLQQQTPSTPTVLVPPAQAPAAPLGPTTVLPCSKRERRRNFPIVFAPSTQPTCQDPLQLIVDTGYVQPLTSNQKGRLAFKAVIDPFNLLTIATFSGISVAADAHSVYGPGFLGWGRLAGYSLGEDVQGEFTGVYVIPSLVHEDPRYHRMPKAATSRRIEHALIHTFVSQHDDGSLMPNYATLINIPLSAEISNLYVPEIGTNIPDTAKRVLVGYATDPIGPLVAEFLPDFAKRVHIHIVFAQQILNRLALGSGAPSSSY